MTIQQGHRYLYKGRDVLALKTKTKFGITIALVAEIHEDCLWPLDDERFVVDEVHLTPLPMRYFHGEAPA